MKVNCEFEGIAVGKPSIRKSQDGKTDYFDLGVVSRTGEAGTFGCTKEVYEDIALMKEYCFVAQFNTEYKTFRIISVRLLGDLASAPAAPTGKKA